MGNRILQDCNRQLNVQQLHPAPHMKGPVDKTTFPFLCCGLSKLHSEILFLANCPDCSNANI
jgi:hypothetical protein